MPDRPILNTDEVAELFGISARHLKRLLKKGEFLEPVRLGKSIRWVRSHLDEWIASGCQRQRQNKDA